MATLAIVNGKVWSRPNASAVVVDGDRILAVGADDRGVDRVVDAGGSWIIPAFNDAHVHFLIGSRSLSELDLFGVQTQSEIERRVVDYARRHDGPWVVGRGWFYSAFHGGMPSVELLDRLVPDRPAYVESFDAHSGWANSRALELAGVAKREVLLESAMLAVTRIIPHTREGDLDALRAGMRSAASKGIGSVQEAGDGRNQLHLWDALRDSGELTMRVRLAFDLTPGMDLDVYEDQRRPRDDWVSTGILKAFADGVVESKTAAMLAPYAGAHEKGDPIWGPSELREAVQTANARGWQVQIHAIGDAAIRQALDAFEGTSPALRHRIEHIETPDPADVARFAKLGVLASMQPQHAAPGMIEVWSRHLGPERAARGWPWKALSDSGARLAFGTDWPVVPLDPFASIAEARRDMSLEAAVAAWTSGGAYAEHSEARKGELRPGMLADIAVVDFDAGVAQATIVGGRVVYET